MSLLGAASGPLYPQYTFARSSPVPGTSQQIYEFHVDEGDGQTTRLYQRDGLSPLLTFLTESDCPAHRIHQAEGQTHLLFLGMNPSCLEPTEGDPSPSSACPVDCTAVALN